MTGITRPACGYVAEHDAHEYGSGVLRDALHCNGLLAAGAAAIRLFETSVTLAYAADRLPELAGLRVECHPSVVNALMRAVVPNFSDPGPPRLLFPLYTISDMPPDSWRIVAASDGTTGDRLAAAREREDHDERK